MRESWKNVFGVLESPGNFSEQKSGNPELSKKTNMYSEQKQNKNNDDN